VPGADEGGHSPTPLHELLTEARALGFLGPGPLGPQIQHARGFAAIARRLCGGGEGHLVDLGAGGGLPGLVMATEWPEVKLALLEANGRRAAFLRRAVERLDLETRVSVLEERAEVCGREPGSRAGFDGVVARSFGRPAVLAECAAPLLKVGGWLLVSEPPRSEEEGAQDTRWPSGPLRRLGLEPTEVMHEGFEYRTLRQRELCPERFPRRNGVPAKRPLF
jgi:16S rRNA (guanine527-N7)-methyltransferase